MIRLRSVVGRDVGAVMQVMDRAFEPQFGEAWNGAQLVAALDAANSFAALADDGGDPLGFALARVVADEAELLLMAVDPVARRRGIATALLDDLAHRARARGGRVLFLEVRDGNAAAHALYRSLGFREIGRRPAYYAGGNQTRYDAITMQRSL
ncbi:MAG: ribosomal protein S18-alanine N-acetyltransferase [Sphingomonadaceae bacterium]|nr:ribosomal protein S18-alanine N-acetyltransferase [Sphingomonadaceae bacterium]